MYLIHQPLRISGKVEQYPIPKESIHPLDIKGVWEGMEECKNLGLTKGIGVSNFTCKKLEELLSIAKIPPSINQVSQFFSINSINKQLCIWRARSIEMNNTRMMYLIKKNSIIFLLKWILWFISYYLP